MDLVGALERQVQVGGLAILDRCNENRTYKRTQDYLLAGIIYRRSGDGKEARLTGSTSNAGRASGGTSYYRVASAGSVSFQCLDIDDAVAAAITRIQVDPALLPLIRTSYTQELGEVLGLVRPDERAKLRAILTEIDGEEIRMARMLASGKISEKTWDELWSEWRDRRQQIGRTLHFWTRNKRSTSRIWQLHFSLSRASERCIMDFSARIKKNSCVRLSIGSL